MVVVTATGPVEAESNEVFVRRDGTLYIIVGSLNEKDEWVERELDAVLLDHNDSVGEA